MMVYVFVITRLVKFILLNGLRNCMIMIMVVLVRSLL